METQTIGELIKAKLSSAPVEIVEIDWKARALEAEEQLALINACATDVVTFWPKMSWNMVLTMMPLMDALKASLIPLN